MRGVFDPQYFIKRTQQIAQIEIGDNGFFSARIAASLDLFFFSFSSLTILEIYWNKSSIGNIPNMLEQFQIYLKYSKYIGTKVVLEVFQICWNYSKYIGTIPNTLELFQIY